MTARNYLFKKITKMENDLDHSILGMLNEKTGELPRDQAIGRLLALCDPVGDAPKQIQTVALLILSRFLVEEEAAKHPERAIGGVMTVPAIANIDEWERVTKYNQELLVAGAGDHVGPPRATNYVQERSTLSEAELEAIAGTNGELQLLTAQQRLNRDLADVETERIRKLERQEQERVDQVRVKAENAPAPKTKAKPAREVQRLEGLPKGNI